GATSFQEKWVELLKDKEVLLCFDNDEAGANGMVKVLDYIPNAKIIFLPDRVGVKDITDYVANGGDLPELIKSAKHFENRQDVQDDYAERNALWKSVHFHEEYFKNDDKKKKTTVRKKVFKDSKNPDTYVAKQYPIDQLLDFKQNKCACIWHNEKTASMHYYKDNNRVWCFGCGKGGDSIDVFMKVFNVSFSEAVKKLCS
ncbi:unnamed protein product, partial [marine sediment metagenome]